MAPCQRLVAAACLCVGARARAYWEVQDGFCEVDGEGCIKTAEFMGGDYMGGVNCNFRVIREDWKRSDRIVVEYFDVDPNDWLQIPLTGPNGLVSQIDLHAGTETGSGWYPNGIHWYPDDGHIIDLGPGKMQPTGVVTFFSTSPSPHGRGFRVCPSSSNPLLVRLLVGSAAISFYYLSSSSLVRRPKLLIQIVLLLLVFRLVLERELREPPPELGLRGRRHRGGRGGGHGGGQPEHGGGQPEHGSQSELRRWSDGVGGSPLPEPWTYKSIQNLCACNYMHLHTYMCNSATRLYSFAELHVEYGGLNIDVDMYIGACTRHVMHI